MCSITIKTLIQWDNLKMIALGPLCIVIGFDPALIHLEVPFIYFVLHPQLRSTLEVAHLREQDCCYSLDVHGT